MKRQSRFISLLLLVILFVFLLSRINYIYLEQVKTALIGGLIVIPLTAIIVQIIDKEYKLGYVILLEVLLIVGIPNFSDREVIVILELIFSGIFIFIYFFTCFFPKPAPKFILPIGFKKSHYNIFLILLSIIVLVFGILFSKLNIGGKIIAIIVLFFVLFLLFLGYQVVSQAPVLKVYNKFIQTSDYETLKKELNELKKDDLNIETINQVNIILFTHAIDYDKEYCEELKSQIFEPKLRQYLPIYNQAMASYYISKNMFEDSRKHARYLINSKNRNLVLAGKRIECIIKLGLKEEITIEEIDEVAKYDNLIDTLATYQLYLEYYRERDYNKYIEYSDKIKDIKDKIH